MTGGRLKRVAGYIQDDEAFCFTYGDGLSDVNIAREHRIPPSARTARHGYGGASAGALWGIECAGDRVTRFVEKPRGDGGLINGGFFVLSPAVLDLH